MLICAASLAIASIPALADTNLITNGGFETGDFTGWTYLSGSESVQPNYGAGYTAHSGEYFAIFGNIGSDGAISQSFTDTAGETLTLSFYLTSNGETPNDFNVYVDDVSYFSETDIAAQGWTLYSYTFTATGDDTIELAGMDDPSFLALDDVSVTAASEPAAAPEPSDLALLGTGLLGVAAAARRRRFRHSC